MQKKLRKEQAEAQAAMLAGREKTKRRTTNKRKTMRDRKAKHDVL